MGRSARLAAKNDLYSTLRFGRFLKASRNFSLETLPAPEARADLAAACSWPTVASEALQDLQETMEELVAFSGAAKSVPPQAAQVSILGEFIGVAFPYRTRS
jgi:hypothetical protein